jgi:pimeloyl-ACP methyl ester carboxylesterase
MRAGIRGTEGQIVGIQGRMLNATAKFVTTAEVRFEYFEFGDAAGAPLILLHGFPDAPIAWAGVVSRLELSKLRVLVPYLRGYGGTEARSSELIGGQEAALGSDLLGFADALGVERFHLAGHDWGVRASYAACVLAPERVRSLLALATPYVRNGGRPHPPEGVRAQWYQWFFQLELGRTMFEKHGEAFSRELWRSWSPTWDFSEEEFATAAKAWKNPQFVESVLHYYRTRWGGALGLRAYAELQAKLNAEPRPKISVPTIYAQGAVDGSDLPSSSEEQADYFTGGYERVLLDGVGHFPQREDAETVAKLLARSIKLA